MLIGAGTKNITQKETARVILLFIYVTLHLYVPSTTLPQAGRLWCADCESQLGNLLQFQFHSPA